MPAGRRDELRNELIEHVRQLTSHFQDRDIKWLAAKRDIDGVLDRAYQLDALAPRDELLRQFAKRGPAGPAADAVRAGNLITYIEVQTALIAAVSE